MTSAALYTMIIARSRKRVSFVDCCFGSACRRLSSCRCRLAALMEVNSEMEFVKQVHKCFGATAKWAMELLGLPFAKRSAGAGWERSAFAQQRPAHTQCSAGCACRAELSAFCLAFPGWKRVSQPPVSPRLCTALREVFSEELRSATERR